MKFNIISHRLCLSAFSRAGTCTLFFVLLWGYVRHQNAMADQEIPPMTSSGKPAITSVLPNLTTVPRFEKFELTIELSASYDNPFDPEQVALSAEFVSPSGKKITAPGFFCQAYRNRNENDDRKRPLLDAVGNPCWKARFAPTEVGRYEYEVRLINRFGDADQEVRWGPANFECTASRNHGFIRVSPTNHRYFQFDDGTPFFAVGQNLQNDWPCAFHFRLLAESGCNAARVWTFCHWSWLEWTFKPDIPWAKDGDWMRSYAGAGRYNQRIAWVADHHLAQCERDGLRLMFCLGNATGQGELSKGGGYGSWDGHPYNVANGGFLDEPGKFWTDERARKLYKQRLRYIIARYGYSPNVWAWEFWNELGEARPEIVAWHREMGDTVRALDPNRHLITSSTWHLPEKFNAIWDLSQMDFTQSHIYDCADAIRRGVGRGLRDHPSKPHIVGEGGGPAPRRAPRNQGGKAAVDPEGIEFHNSLWAAAMSGAAGTTLPWWWRDRIEADNLFFHYTAIARFVKDEPWATMKLEPAKPARVSLAAEPAERRFSPVVIVPAGSGWEAKAPRNHFVVQPDGTVPHIEDMRSSLFGSVRSAWRNPPIFAVSYPVAGRFTVHVAETAHGVLDIVLDGRLALREESLNVHRQEVGKEFSIDVPAGEHEIELCNSGADWVQVGHILLSNYRDSAKYPDVDIYGVQSPDAAFLWVHHRLNDWSFRAMGCKPEPITGAKAQIAGLADGAYRVEWWDTYNGEVTRTEEKNSQGGLLLDLDLPAIQTDIACKIKRGQ